MKKPHKDHGGYRGFAFSRTVGWKYWCCARCNQVNQTQIRPQSWIVKCSNEACMTRWAIGEVFYEVAQGFKAPPPDTIMPSVETLATGKSVNQVYCSGCAEIIYKDEFHRALIPNGDPGNTHGLYVLPGWEKQGYERRRFTGLYRRALRNPSEMKKLLDDVKRIAEGLGYEVVRRSPDPGTGEQPMSEPSPAKLPEGTEQAAICLPGKVPERPANCHSALLHVPGSHIS